MQSSAFSLTSTEVLEAVNVFTDLESGIGIVCCQNGTITLAFTVVHAGGNCIF